MRVNYPIISCTPPKFYLFLYLTTGFLCLCGRDAPDEDGPAGTGGADALREFLAWLDDDDPAGGAEFLRERRAGFKEEISDDLKDAIKKQEEDNKDAEIDSTKVKWTRSNFKGKILDWIVETKTK